MKKILFPLLVALLFGSLTKAIVIVPSLHIRISNVGNDTTFLLREKDNEHYHAVFVEKNRQSQAYKNVLNFKMDSYDKESYLQNYRALKAHAAKPFKKYNLAHLPTAWLPLYSYKGKFYIYLPSEPGNMDRVIITDSTLIHWYMDGPLPQRLKGLNKLNKYTWQLKLQDYNPNDHESGIMIYMIDPIKKIAVWENPTAPAKYRYSLYVSSETAAKFDLIVNYCRENRESEFIFDSIDYTALLKKVKPIALRNPANPTASKHR
jgi:hypothetical protein